MLTDRERRIMEEAYTCGRVYENMLDQPKPAAEYMRMEQACIRAANRKTEEQVEADKTSDNSDYTATLESKLKLMKNDKAGFYTQFIDEHDWAVRLNAALQKLHCA